MDEAAIKKQTDCLYYIASPLACTKGDKCEFRHSDYARLNPTECRYWLTTGCTRINCPFRHPPLDGRSVPSLPNRAQTPCIFFAQGACMKGDKCPFLHLPLGPAETEKQQQQPAFQLSSQPQQQQPTFQISSQPQQQQPTFQISSQPQQQQPTFQVSSQPQQQQEKLQHSPSWQHDQALQQQFKPSQQEKQHPLAGKQQQQQQHPVPQRQQQLEQQQQQQQRPRHFQPEQKSQQHARAVVGTQSGPAPLSKNVHHQVYMTNQQSASVNDVLGPSKRARVPQVSTAVGTDDVLDERQHQERVGRRPQDGGAVECQQQQQHEYYHQQKQAYQQQGSSRTESARTPMARQQRTWGLNQSPREEGEVGFEDSDSMHARPARSTRPTSSRIEVYVPPKGRRWVVDEAVDDEHHTSSPRLPAGEHSRNAVSQQRSAGNLPRGKESSVSRQSSRPGEKLRSAVSSESLQRDVNGPRSLYGKRRSGSELTEYELSKEELNCITGRESRTREGNLERGRGAVGQKYEQGHQRWPLKVNGPRVDDAPRSVDGVGGLEGGPSRVAHKHISHSKRHVDSVVCREHVSSTSLAFHVLQGKMNPSGPVKGDEVISGIGGHRGASSGRAYDEGQATEKEAGADLQGYSRQSRDRPAAGVDVSLDNQLESRGGRHRDTGLRVGGRAIGVDSSTWDGGQITVQAHLQGGAGNRRVGMTGVRTSSPALGRVQQQPERRQEQEHVQVHKTTEPLGRTTDIRSSQTNARMSGRGDAPLPPAPVRRVFNGVGVAVGPVSSDLSVGRGGPPVPGGFRGGRDEGWNPNGATHGGAGAGMGVRFGGLIGPPLQLLGRGRDMESERLQRMAGAIVHDGGAIGRGSILGGHFNVNVVMPHLLPPANTMPSPQPPAAVGRGIGTPEQAANFDAPKSLAQILAQKHAKKAEQLGANAKQQSNDASKTGKPKLVLRRQPILDSGIPSSAPAAVSASEEREKPELSQLPAAPQGSRPVKLKRTRDAEQLRNDKAEQSPQSMAPVTQRRKVLKRPVIGPAADGGAVSSNAPDNSVMADEDKAHMEDSAEELPEDRKHILEEEGNGILEEENDDSRELKEKLGREKRLFGDEKQRDVDAGGEKRLLDEEEHRDSEVYVTSDHSDMQEMVDYGSGLQISMNDGSEVESKEGLLSEMHEDDRTGGDLPRGDPAEADLAQDAGIDGTKEPGFMETDDGEEEDEFAKQLGGLFS
ncbi:hypothetical protein CBR_g16918 [Chara braunii]|uniref:C3H1-type domain-containing protein n=1 Tax=Chara braunii TaxID=69332 RepID=A0A388KU31_CHABU|nr:hypothetical protein CBR_g16918 [Chara braunii]|eukprot:GBG73574.1 hypothetical protein CBR_g16918 [Chara braunii]